MSKERKPRVVVLRVCKCVCKAVCMSVSEAGPFH